MSEDVDILVHKARELASRLNIVLGQLEVLKVHVLSVSWQSPETRFTPFTPTRVRLALDFEEDS